MMRQKSGLVWGYEVRADANIGLLWCRFSPSAYSLLLERKQLIVSRIAELRKK
jgi:hypothetical protein